MQGVSANLITTLSHPRWAKTIAYLGVVIQCIVSVQASRPLSLSLCVMVVCWQWLQAVSFPAPIAVLCLPQLDLTAACEPAQLRLSLSGALLQACVSMSEHVLGCEQVYASPIYETVDTKFGDAKTWTTKNIILRFVYR